MAMLVYRRVFETTAHGSTCSKKPMDGLVSSFIALTRLEPNNMDPLKHGYLEDHPN